MQRLVIILIFNTYMICFMFCSVSMAASTTLDSDAVAIFAGGQHYQGLADYRKHKALEKIKHMVKKYKGLKLKMLLTLLRQEISQVDINRLGGDKAFVDIIKELYQQDQPVKYKSQFDKNVSREKGSFSEMKRMLDDYLKQHKEASAVSLDPDKIKTIIIPSKHNKSYEIIPPQAN